ncbi:MAG: hypothetical protein EBW03_08290 [Rhodobacteraceae bacterium]|jgi:hypothetical protein|nr:hypothetical protein [Paracoccaceae bacterium]
MIGQILFSVTGMVTSWLDSKETTDQLFHRHECAMHTAALKRHVVVAYGVELGHVCSVRIYVIISVSVAVVAIMLSAVLYVPPYLQEQQRLRDGSMGCAKYRRMYREAVKSYQENPNGKKHVREFIAAEGLMNKHRCTSIGEQNI